jgi:hypothetical protein
MILRFRNCSSNPKALPGGCPQGTLIGVILYILYINPVGYPGEITLQINDLVKNYWNQLGSVPDLLPSSNILPVTMEAINLKTTLATKLDRSGPIPSWESSCKLLPVNNCSMQSEIENSKRISDEREMVLNPGKTKLIFIYFKTVSS